MRTISSPNGKYRLQSKIGSGKSAEVFLATSQNTLEDCALKIIPKHSVIGKQAREAVLREFELLSKISHENVIGYIDHFADGENYYLVTEYFCSSTVTDRVIQSGALAEPLIIKLLSQLCNVISFLHRNSVAHQNISPDNILINDANEIKIIDFGSASSEVQSQTASDIPFHASPPEINPGRFYIPSLVDSWQLGYFLYFVFTNDYPWHGISVGSLSHPQLEIPPAIPKKVHTLLQSLLEMNPLRRYSVEQAGSYYWLSRPFSKVKSSVTYHSVMSPFISNNNVFKSTSSLNKSPQLNLSKRHSMAMFKLNTSDSYTDGPSPLISKYKTVSSPTFQ